MFFFSFHLACVPPLVGNLALLPGVVVDAAPPLAPNRLGPLSTGDVVIVGVSVLLLPDGVFRVPAAAGGATPTLPIVVVPSVGPSPCGAMAACLQSPLPEELHAGQRNLLKRTRRELQCAQGHSA